MAFIRNKWRILVMKNYSSEVLNNLPGCVCETLQKLSNKYSKEPWYEEACDRYSYHVLTTDMDHVRMPGYIFGKYIKDNGLEHSEDICNKDYVKSILEHGGILGMKWGVRRFQNKDGTLTEEGKKRYAASYNRTKESMESAINRDIKDENGDVKKIRVTEQDIIKKMDTEETKKDLKSTQSVLQDTSDLVNQSKNIVPYESGKTIRTIHPEMTDADLQKRINRLKLEQQYSDISGETKYIKSGSEKAREILQTAGAIVAVGATTVGIASKIYSMLHDRDNIGIDASSGGKKKKK